MAGYTSRVLVVVTLGIVMLGLTALTHSLGQVGSSGFEPKVAAFFKENDKLQVAVFLKDGHKGSLQVALTSKGAARIATQPRDVNQAEGVGRYLFEIPAARSDAVNTSLQITLGTQ